MDAVPVPAAPPAARSALMSRVKKVGTQPELLLRSELHRRGLRYRVQLPVPLAPRRTIDVALTRARIAVFVDGCFWHGCPEHLHLPRHNRDWWRWKLSTVHARDRDTDRLLLEQGWAVLRVWEHEDPAVVGEDVERLWRARTDRRARNDDDAVARTDQVGPGHRVVRCGEDQLQPLVEPQPSQT